MFLNIRTENIICSSPSNIHWKGNHSTNPPNPLSHWLGGSGENGYRPFQRPGFGYSEYALFDAMKRAVASVAAHPNGYCIPPSQTVLTPSTNGEVGGMSIICV